MPELRTLGSLQLIDPSQPARRGRRMVLAMLAWLLRSRGRHSTRDRMVDLFWPRSDPSAARHSLRQALTEARNLLPDGALWLEGDRVALAEGALQLDLQRFEEAVANRDWPAAIAGYDGPFLVDGDDIGGPEWRAWVEAERTAAARMLGAAFEQVIETAAARGGWAEAINLAQRWVALAPGDESAELALIQLLLMAGQRERAAGHHAGLLARLAADGTEPSPLLIRLGRQLKAPTPSIPQARGLLTPDLVGREPAFATLTAAWLAAGTGGSRVVVLEGEEGSGKTRLAQEFIRSVRTRDPGQKVAAIRAYHMEADQPFRVLGSLLDEVADSSGLAACGAEDLLALGAVSAAVRQRFAGLPGQPTADHGIALTHALSEIAAESPVLLFLDDADQADPDSLRSIATLSRRLPARVMLLLAVRPQPPGAPPLPGVPPELVVRIRMDPLDMQDAVALVGSMGPVAPDSARALAEAGVQDLGGNPGNIRALVTELADTGVLSLDPSGVWELHAPLGRPVALPEGAQARTLRLLHEISTSARDLLHLAAAAGSRVPRSTLARASGFPDEALRAGLGELTSRRLLRPSDGTAGHLDFASEAARRAVLDTLELSQQTELARRLSSVRSGGRPRRWRVVGATVGITALVGIIGVTIIKPADKVPIEVLLADVRSSSGDPSLDRTLSLVAGIELQESSSIRLVPRTRIREALARMGRPGADSVLDEHLAREVAEREGVPRVLSLDAVHAGGRILLTAQLLVPGTGAVEAAISESANSEGELLEAMGRMLRQVRRRLGERPIAPSEVPDLPRVSTHSLAALRAYSLGRIAWTERKYPVAKEAWHRAVGLDSGFALAWSSLADEAYRANDAPLGDRLLRRAEALSGTLTQREQLALRTQLARRFGTTAEALAATGRMAEAYPDRDTWYSLGTALMQARQCDRALPALARSLEHDRQFTNAHVNRATCFQFLQQFDSALAAYHLAGGLDSTVLLWSNVGEEYGSALRMTGRRAEAVAHFERVIARGQDGIKARGHRQLAWMAMAEGRFAAAIRSAQEAVRLVGLVDDPVGMFRARLVLARAYLGAGDSAAARQEYLGAWKQRPPDRLAAAFYVYAAHLALRLGLPTVATDAAGEAVRVARVGVVADDVDRATSRAIGELANGRPARALEETNRFWPRPASERWGYLDAVRARALVGVGQLDSALVAYRQMSSSPWVGWEIEEVSARVDLEVARLAARLGQPTEALAAIDRFLGRWRDADRTAPEYQAALTLRDQILREGTR